MFDLDGVLLRKCPRQAPPDRPHPVPRWEWVRASCEVDFARRPLGRDVANDQLASPCADLAE